MTQNISNRDLANPIQSMSVESHNRVPQTVSWCFKPSQPQRIISGLKETFIKSCIVERTKEAEIRPKEQSEKAKSCWANLWNEVQLKGP